MFQTTKQPAVSCTKRIQKTQSMKIGQQTANSSLVQIAFPRSQKWKQNCISQNEFIRSNEFMDPKKWACQSALSIKVHLGYERVNETMVLSPAKRNKHNDTMAV